MANLQQLWLRIVASFILLQFKIETGVDAQYVLDVIKMSSHDDEELVLKCAATGANFGKEIAEFIMSDKNMGCALAVNPIDACTSVTVSKPSSCPTPYAMVSRSSSSKPCKFSQQAFNVQNSTIPFKLVIFYNKPNEDPITMDGSEKSELVYLPVIMISYDCMEEIMKTFPASKKYALRVRIDPGYYELFRYLIPFVVVIVFCFALFLITLCIRGCVERRKMNKRRLSKRNLKKIPVKKYRAGEEPDTCAICLEDYLTGEKLRHLPCRHVFHCKCIDVWLTQTRKVCPLCKRKIGSDSDSDGSTEDLRSSSQPSTSSRNAIPPVNQGQSTGRAGETWSSQEALVDHDMVFVEPVNRRTLGGMLRNIFRRIRGTNNSSDEESASGMENNAYHTQNRNIVSTDGDHLLEHEEPTSSSADQTSSTLADSSDLTIETSSADTTSTLDTIIPSNDTLEYP